MTLKLGLTVGWEGFTSSKASWLAKNILAKAENYRNASEDVGIHRICYDTLPYNSRKLRGCR